MHEKLNALKKDVDHVINELEKRGLKHNDDYDVVGIGDIVEDALKSIGITEDRFKEFWNIEECACTQRKKWLNSLLYWRRKRKNLETTKT